MPHIVLEKGWACELPEHHSIYQSMADFNRYSVHDQEEESVLAFHITSDVCTVTSFKPWQHQIQIDTSHRIIRLIHVDSDNI